MDDDQKRFIVTLVLLVVLVLLFFGIVFAIVYAMVKVNKVAAPIRSVARVVKRVRSGIKKAKGVGKRVAKIKSIGPGVRKDLRSLEKQFRTHVQKTKTKLKTHIERAMTFLSGDPCAKFDQLWTQHVNLTFYYGALALTSLEPISVEQKAKMDWAATRLLDIQEELSNLMKSCVADSQQSLLTQLLKEHILIVAQMAEKWRKERGLKPFDPQLVAAWYKNADNTVSLLESKTGKRDNNLQEQYRAHLNWTAGYLIEMTKNRGRFLMPTKKTFEVFAEALDHVPMLAAAFCTQMQACMKN